MLFFDLFESTIQDLSKIEAEIYSSIVPPDLVLIEAIFFSQFVDGHFDSFPFSHFLNRLE